MLKIVTNLLNKPSKQYTNIFYSISNWKKPALQIDSAGIGNFLECSTKPHLTFGQKLSQIHPSSLYSGLDQWSRQLIMTLSNDYGIGICGSILAITLALKFLFLKSSLRSQSLNMKMMDCQNITESYKQKMKTAQMTMNKALLEQATYNYKMNLRKKGINRLVIFKSMMQVPFLITWFLSIRYMSSLPEIYPSFQVQGWLWFTDLTTYDPYFVLPMLAAICSSLSIIKSPNMSANSLRSQNPMFAEFYKYIKFMPFLSLPFTAFFPASMNFYWFILAAFQLFNTELLYMSFIKKRLGIQNKQVVNIPKNFTQAVFVQQKQTSQNIMKKSKANDILNNLSQDIKKKAKKIEVTTQRPKKIKNRQ